MERADDRGALRLRVVAKPFAFVSGQDGDGVAAFGASWRWG